MMDYLKYSSICSIASVIDFMAKISAPTETKNAVMFSINALALVGAGLLELNSLDFIWLNSFLTKLNILINFAIK